MSDLTTESLFADEVNPARVECCVGLVLVASCGTNSPQVSELAKNGGTPTSSSATLEAAPSSTKTGAVSSNMPASIVAGEAETIIGFRGPTVVVYSGEFRNDGERLAASALPLPLRSRSSASNPLRVEIMTAAGRGWIARSEVSFAASGATTHSVQ